MDDQCQRRRAAGAVAFATAASVQLIAAIAYLYHLAGVEAAQYAPPAITGVGVVGYLTASGLWLSSRRKSHTLNGEPT